MPSHSLRSVAKKFMEMSWMGKIVVCQVSEVEHQMVTEELIRLLETVFQLGRKGAEKTEQVSDK